MSERDRVQKLFQLLQENHILDPKSKRQIQLTFESVYGDCFDMEKISRRRRMRAPR